MDIDHLHVRRTRRTYLLMVVLGMLLFAGGQQVWQATTACAPSFDLLNTTSICDASRTSVTEWDYEPLRQELLERVGYYTESGGTVPQIALFFRDLQNGPRFSIREDQDFTAASLLKLPIMMVILHHADGHAGFLDERVTYATAYGDGPVIEQSAETLELHASYTVRELLEKMIRYSDNPSSYVLLEKINALGLREKSNTFADFGTFQLLMNGELDNTRLISLVNVFVALYNASYLSQESSQFALELLTQTTFHQGIVAGVPENVSVAHKFGVRTGVTVQDELHDCGIVYHPTAPYALCILTAGADVDTASAAIRDLSKIVYDNVERLKP